MSESLLSLVLINDIGHFLGFEMGDKNIKYDFPGGREVEHSPGDALMVGTIFPWVGKKAPVLLLFQNWFNFNVGCCGPAGKKSQYVLNLDTLKPTKKSPKQTELSDDLLERLRGELKPYYKRKKERAKPNKEWEEKNEAIKKHYAQHKFPHNQKLLTAFFLKN